jgi:hypothetical protein
MSQKKIEQKANEIHSYILNTDTSLLPSLSGEGFGVRSFLRVSR